MLNSNHLRHSLFFAHLALEKILKAIVCNATNDLAPRIHSLRRLSEIASLELSQSQVDLLAEMSAFNIEGRYPDMIILLLTKEEAHEYLGRVEEVLKWLMKRLP